MTHYKNTPSSNNIEKVSAWTESASITVEAALILPLFLFAVLLIIYQVEIAIIETKVEAGINSAAKKVAEEILINPILNLSKLESESYNAIGKDRIEHSMIENGIHFSGSYLDPYTGVIHIKAKYVLRLPFPHFMIPSIKRTEEMKIKAWTGYRKPLLDGMQTEMVYITDYASVYHKDYHCTHLQLSVRMVSEKEIGKLRNINGKRYSPCSICGKRPIKGGVYVTEEGECYHTTANCSGLKRTIYTVPLSTVKDKGACSRCGQ